MGMKMKKSNVVLKRRKDRKQAEIPKGKFMYLFIGAKTRGTEKKKN
jgi:hypothetical protein